MQYPYGVIYAAEEGMLELVSKLVSGVPFAFSIAGYVLTALALYAIASRRGIRHPWLSWIPVINIWILGSISDQFRYVVKGEIKSKRKVLLVLNIIASVLTVILVGILVAFVLTFLFGAVIDSLGWFLGILFQDPQLNPHFERAALGSSVPWTLMLLSIPTLGIDAALHVIRFMALYDLYTSCDPQNNVLYLVLSILFPVTEPLFLLFSRNKDQGMPPRRQGPVYIPYVKNGEPH